MEQKYNAWSPTYDRELNLSHRNCPEFAAEKLDEYIADKSAAILDAGVGTGMAGKLFQPMAPDALK